MNVDENAKIIWDYMKVAQPLERADAIFVLCSHDIRVADRAAELYSQRLAEYIILSGGAGKFTKDIFDKPEAEVFKERLVSLSVPEDKIIVESKASNTGENIRFTHELLQSLNMTFASFILVQKPYMERRTYATFKQQWPDKNIKFTVTSPQLSYEEYMQAGSIHKDFAISVMVGDLQRIKEYPKLGYQIEQDIPPNVWQAFENLVASGYDKRLLNNS